MSKTILAGVFLLTVLLAATKSGLASQWTDQQRVEKLIERANQGDVNAEFQLASMYAKGLGVPQNLEEAVKWYYTAALAGNARAQFELGMLYNKGMGVPKDYFLAYYWFNVSASGATGGERDFRMRARDALASKLTPQQVLMAQQMGLER